MRMKQILLPALMLALAASCSPSVENMVNGEVWTDTEGRAINAHGGGILYHEGRYYWYGECKEGETVRLDWVTSWECWRTEAGGVSCYSSDDLVNWKYEGLALVPDYDNPDSDIHPSKVIERPKVLFNEKTGKFVMWCHIESPDYEKATAGVAVSDSPAGPFEYLGSFKPNGADSRDQTLFKDDDGRAYQIYSSEWNKTLYIGLLNEEYTGHSGVYTRNFIDCSREAPAVFKQDGKYYMITSGCSGWDPNVAQVAVADSMLGHWTVLGNPCKGEDAENTYHAQSTFVLPVSGQDFSHIAMFDRWNKTDLADSRYIWLPLSVKDGMPEVQWEEKLPLRPLATGFDDTYYVFNNWSAYDELSDNVPLTEELSLRLLDKVLEMKAAGVQVDAYLMDAFWFDRDGGYRLWRKDCWPEGPGRWLEKCLKNGITPGLWFSTNLIMSGGEYLVRPVEAWKDSQTSDPSVLSLFEGGYLDDLMDVLQGYYDMGFRLFKFDFAYFDAATDAAKASMGREEIISANINAFLRAISRFRERNPEARFLAYNGFGGDMEDTVREFRKTVDPCWLSIFDTMYCGDPRFSDVPMRNIWRSEDLYSDHMIRQFLFNGVPGARIDDCSVMVGRTGTCYGRGTNAWKSSLLLNYARPGRLKVCHGSIDLLDKADFKWMKKAQGLYAEARKKGYTSIVGGIPGKTEPYGYRCGDGKDCIYTIVNPGQDFVQYELGSEGLILFTDSGFEPSLEGGKLLLGPEQMAVVGCGCFASGKYGLGKEEDVVIPRSVKEFNYLEQTPAAGSTVRVVVEIKDADGKNYRTWPQGGTMGEYIQIKASDGDGAIELDRPDDRVIWSGMSWGVAEFKSRGKAFALDCKIDYFGTAVPCSIKTYTVEY